MPKQKHGATLKAPVNSGKIEIVSNRVKTPGDLEQIVELDFKTFSVPSGLPTIEIARKALSPWLDNPGTGLVTAYVDDHVVGYCLHCIIPFSEIKDYEQAASAKGLKIDKRGRVIDSIAVQKRYRGNGIGTSMVKRAISDSKPQGTRQIYALCWKGAQGDSYPIFMKQGFKELTTVQGKFGDGALAVYVVKQL